MRFYVNDEKAFDWEPITFANAELNSDASAASATAASTLAQQIIPVVELFKGAHILIEDAISKK